MTLTKISDTSFVGIVSYDTLSSADTTCPWIHLRKQKRSQSQAIEMPRAAKQVIESSPTPYSMARPIKALTTELKRLDKDRVKKLNANSKKWKAGCIAATCAALYNVDPEMENDLDDLIITIACLDRERRVETYEANCHNLEEVQLVTPKLLQGDPISWLSVKM